MVVADSRQSLTITGNGDVLEPHDGIIGTAVATAAMHCPHRMLQQLSSAADPDKCMLCSHRLRRWLCTGGSESPHRQPRPRGS